MSLRHFKGFYLVEVLATMVILAVGLLGIGMMQMLAQKAVSSSYLRGQALQSATNIIERMRANKQQAINGAYNASNLVTSGSPTIPSTPSTNCSSSTCSPAQLATYDSWDWLANDVSLLPNGAGSITTTTSGINTVVTVVVQWNDAPAQSLLGAGGNTSSGNSAIAQLSLATSL